MTQGDDDERRRTKHKKRVTLKWDTADLLLPGESPPQRPNRESGELALPELSEADRATRDRSAEPPANPDGHDAWERQRPAVTPPPPLPSKPPGPDVEDGGALSLVDKRGRPPSSPAIDLFTEMRDRFALGDYTAALRIAELLLGQQPDHEEARQISTTSRIKLAQLYESRLGSLDRVPRVAVEPTDVRWLGLDHKAGFLLSQVDGVHTIGELLDVSGMPRIDALKMLVELLDQGAIRFPE